MRTTANTASTDLIDRLITRLGDTVHVQKGLPADVPRRLERVYLARILNLNRTRRTQQGARLETYDLEFVVEVEKTGSTTALRDSTETRLWELVDEIEQEILADEELGDVADDSDLLQVRELFVIPKGDKTGWIGRAVPIVHVTATV